MRIVRNSYYLWHLPLKWWALLRLHLQAWRPRPLRRSGTVLASPAAMAALALPLFSVLAFLTLPYWAAPLRWQHLQALHQQRLGSEVFDAKGRWLGVVPPLVRGVPYRTLPAEDAPEGFFRVLLALEDRHLGRRTVHGIDVLRIATRVLLAPLGIGKGGGSGLSMQLARALHGMRPGGKTPLLARKALEIIDGAVLYHQLGGRDARPFRSWLATHLPFAIADRGVPLGGDIRGLKLAARILFHKTPHQLTLAEQAVLAAAVQRPVRIAPTPDMDGQRRHKRLQIWWQIRQRAAHGLRLAFGDAPEAQAALAELERMPPPQPRLSSQLRALFPDDPILRLQLAANPRLRAMMLASGPICLALREGEGKGAANCWLAPRPQQLRLTIDVVENLRLARAVRRRLRAIQERFRARLAMDLLGQAHHVVALVDERGRVRRLVAGPHLAWRNRYAAGSIAKMVAAVLLAEQGHQGMQTYCRLEQPPGCQKPENRISARDAFAHSHNQAVMNALRAVPLPRIREVAARFGLEIPPGVNPRAALSLGLMDVSPRQVAAMTLQIAQLAVKGVAIPVQPRLRAKARLQGDPLNSGGIIFAPGKEMRMMLNPKARKYLRQVLAAPLGRGGTLHVLAPFRNRGLLLAKSGTPETLHHRTRAKWIAAALEHKGQLHALVVMVSSPDAHHALGQHLGAAFAPLAAEVIRHLQANGDTE